MGQDEASRELLVKLAEAYDVFQGVVANVRPQQLALATVNDDWTVRDVLNHVIDGDYWAERVLRTGVDEFTDVDYVGDGDLLEAVNNARTAVTLVLGEPGALDPKSSGEGSVEQVVFIRIGELIGHGWDIAQATGQETDLAPELAEFLLAEIRGNLDQPGARGEFFRPAVPIAEDAPAADRLAAYVGKQIPGQV